MSPLTRYQQEVDAGLLKPDSEQLEVMTLLNVLASKLSQREAYQVPKTGLLNRWLSQFSGSEMPRISGLYLWGGVGRGKTHLCDLFYENLDFEDKTRLHFHRFMQRIHTDLRALGSVENPMELVAQKWASQARLLLLDEIHVNDITDAMLLGGLLGALFEKGVTVVTTSNVPPDGLYKDGLQRARFLPAIEQIKQHTHVFEMCGVTDYRLRLLQTEAIYIVTQSETEQHDSVAHEAMQAHFDRLRIGPALSALTLTINERELPLVACASNVVWFSFDALCNTPRSTHDYIDIATLYGTVLISDVPVMDDMRNDAARRWVNLIDELYDRQVKLVMSAEALPEALYVGKRLAFEFVRAASRLTEMQTVEYLSTERKEARQ